MRSRRIITSAIACIAALSAAAAVPAAAPAGSLLSGYGGPGQGSQVILGGSLVNGPPKGGGGSQGASASASAVTGGGGAGTAPPGKTPGGSVAHKHVSGVGGHGGQAKVHPTAASSGVSGVYPVSRDAAVRSAGDGSGTLGVSGVDFLYILLALGALILTGVITKRIAGTSAAGGAGS